MLSQHRNSTRCSVLRATKIKGEIALRAISGDISPKQDKRLDVIESHLNKLYKMYNEIVNAINGKRSIECVNTTYQN